MDLGLFGVEEGERQYLQRSQMSQVLDEQKLPRDIHGSILLMFQVLGTALRLKRQDGLNIAISSFKLMPVGSISDDHIDTST